MSLQDWEKNGWLRPHNAERSEIADLLAVAQRDIDDSRVRALSDDWKFGIAYNAALQLSRAALLVAGYDVPKGESNHFRAIASLEFTLGYESKILDQLDLFRKKRSAGVYLRAGMITESDARDMTSLAQKLQTDARSWIRNRNPNLLP
jgi:hypothetical protein